MEFSNEWRTLFSVSSTHTLPLLIQSPTSLGPLFFNPISTTLSLLLSSPTLSPPFLSPPPTLSLPRFLQTSTSLLSQIPPCSASSISASFLETDLIKTTTGDSGQDVRSSLSQNRLEPLYWGEKEKNRVLVFFPTGDNLDRVGFTGFKVNDSKLVVDFKGSVFKSSVKFDHRIFRLSAAACCVSEFKVVDGECGGGTASINVGYLLACSMYAVHWFSVKVRGYGTDSEKPALVHLGCKNFKTCAVVHACWSPHLTDECVVLLESGEIFLFDLSLSRLTSRFGGKKVGVPWSDVAGGEWEECGWFSCEFAWHPRMLVVSNSKAVYVVDMRFGKYEVNCLVTVESLGMQDMVGEDRFVAFSKGGSDAFLFAVASDHWLLLCDIRKPLMPVLRWAHNMQEPRYLTALPLSVLRSQPSDEKYTEVSKMGFAIVLGSFWNADFGIFCYGPPPPGTLSAISARIAKFSNTVYAWELPSLLSLCGEKCFCGTCLMREEFVRDELPEWMEWQHKRELVLGFFILDRDISASLSKPGEDGGFALVRLKSSGKLELQQYCASSKASTVTAAAHVEKELYVKDSLLCSMGDERYKFPRKFSYLMLEYLYSHLNGDLAQTLFSRYWEAPENARGKKHSNERFKMFLSKKLQSYGCLPPISHLSVSDVFRDVNSPANLHEIVSKVMWIRLPMDILELAFPLYNDVTGEKVSLDFSVIPDDEQSSLLFSKNPSQRSNKWSSKERPSDDFVGPVVPLPASLILCEISQRGHSFISAVDDFSPEDEFARQCKSVLSLAKEMGVTYSNCTENNEHVVSLGDDKEDSCSGLSNPSSFFMYEPTAFSDEIYDSDTIQKPRGYVRGGERYNVVISKLPEKERVDGEMDKDVDGLFKGLCPVELKFDSPSLEFSDGVLGSLQLLKSQYSKWQDGFAPYRNLCSKLKSKEGPR